MAELSEADRYLLKQISRGDTEGWAQLVRAYQGRLLAFARTRLARKEEAEDLVQDTFIAFLEGIARFRENASLETYLFTILRHKLIDFFRGKQVRVCFLQDSVDLANGGEERAIDLPDSGPSVSWYARRDEQDDLLRHSLAAALGELTERLKQSDNFRDLQIIEMLFYAQLRNKDAAKLLNLDEKAVALIKHRALKEIREHVLRQGMVDRASAPMIDAPAWEQAATTSSLLTDVWEQYRPTCPKRTTVGRMLLGTLESPWREYVEFHISRLGCQFCRANLDDLQKQTEEQPQALHHRVVQSTIGFFKPEA